jgi:hypothetical protein
MVEQHVYCPELHGTPAASSFVGDSDIVITTPAAPSSLPAVGIVPSTRRQVLFNGHAQFFSLLPSPFSLLLSLFSLLYSLSVPIFPHLVDVRSVGERIWL